MSNQNRFVALLGRLRREYPHLLDPEQAICDHRVLVDGALITNPRARVERGASLVVRRSASELRGQAKLAAALERFGVSIAGRVCLDLGASAGGFTRVLLEAGARRIYAVDAGYGQLLGSLRVDPRVVNLERTNLGDLANRLVAEPLDVITIDVSYLSLADAAGQLEQVSIARNADLIALVKPMYELRLQHPPEDPHLLAEGVRSAISGFESCGWQQPRSMLSPVRGGRGAIEYLVHLVRG